MKKVLLILVGVLTLVSCQKIKEDTCTSDIMNVPGSIGFFNIDSSSLDTLVVSRYLPNDSFLQKTALDTVMIFHAVTDTGGYIYANSIGFPFLNIDQGNDLGIYLPATGKKFFVHTIYSSDTIVRYQAYGCGLGRTFVQGPEVLIVNGDTVTIGTYHIYFLHP